MLPVREGSAIGKKLVWAGIIRHTLLMDGAKIVRMRCKSRNHLLPSSLEIRTKSAGHLAGERVSVSISVCSCVKTNRMCPAHIRMRVSRFWCPLLEAEFRGVSSHTKRTMPTKKSDCVLMEDANACKATLRMSSRSYSELTIHARVHR